MTYYWMQKILLYYQFTPLADPQAVQLWQKTLCEKLDLKGRILISRHGINGTVGGEMKDLKTYAKETKTYPAFKGIVFKWSDGGREHFPKLSVRVRAEIVAFDAADEVQVDEQGVVGGGTHLTPEQVHQLVRERGDEVVFFDGRNAYEAEVGRFKNAVVPDVRTSRDFIDEIETGKYEALKDKPVVTYCTGGVRCEILSALMKKRGFTEVYQLDGGIVKYGEKFKDDGLWQGSLVVFDDRKKVTFSDQAAVISHCGRCGAETDSYENCDTLGCNDRHLLCATCAAVSLACKKHCKIVSNTTTS